MLGNLFVQLFKSSIIHLIGNSINSSVPSALKSLIQGKILSSNGVLSLGNGLAIDLQFPSEPAVTQNTIGLFINATIFNQSRGYKVPNEPVNDVFLNFSSTSQILIDTSRYTVNSLLLTLHDSQFLQFKLD
jgi:hypothetical protein